MTEILLGHVLPGVAGLALYVTLGVVLGWLLEALGVAARLGRLARPVIRMAALPPICATAFMTTFVSPKAAGGMLAAAYTGGALSRRSLILGATANSFVSGLMHLRVAAPFLIALLGYAGLGYVGFIVGSGAVVLAATLFLGRVWREDPAVQEAAQAASGEQGDVEKRSSWRDAWQRWCRLLPRVLLVAIPVYTLVAYLNKAGAFSWLAARMPPRLASVLPPASMAVIVAQMSGASRAAPVAKEFLDTGELSMGAVFFTLVCGYALSLPVRVLRRNLPGALSLYPGRNGFWIVGLSQGIRFLLATGIVAAWIIARTGRTA